MIVVTKAKVPLKCEGLEKLCVDYRSKKLLNLSYCVNGIMYTTSEKNTHNSLSLDHETLEYDCRLYHKGSIKVLVE